jgi:hypothetical protein
MKATSAAVLLQLDKAGVLEHCKTVVPGEAKVTGRVSLLALNHLRKHPQFSPPVPAILHGADVGSPRIEFRSYRGAFEDDTSLQVVINPKTGAFYADLDRFNPTQDVHGFLAHNILEVWGPKLKRLFTKKKD